MKKSRIPNFLGPVEPAWNCASIGTGLSFTRGVLYRSIFFNPLLCLNLKLPVVMWDWAVGSIKLPVVPNTGTQERMIWRIDRYYIVFDTHGLFSKGMIRMAHGKYWQILQAAQTHGWIEPAMHTRVETFMPYVLEKFSLSLVISNLQMIILTY